jgi:hypothetical protein
LLFYFWLAAASSSQPAASFIKKEYKIIIIILNFACPYFGQRFAGPAEITRLQLAALEVIFSTTIDD